MWQWLRYLRQDVLQPPEAAKNAGPLTLDQIKENGKLTVATEAAYEPFEYMDGDKIIGYNANLFAKICDDLG